MQISLNETIGLIDYATAIVVNHNFLAYPQIEEDENESIFMRVENADIRMEFATENNKTVFRDGPFLTLKNTDGEDTTLMLLAPMSDSK